MKALNQIIENRTEFPVVYAGVSKCGVCGKAMIYGFVDLDNGSLRKVDNTEVVDGVARHKVCPSGESACVCV